VVALRVEPRDLLVERHGLRVEAVARELLRHPQVGVDRLLALALLQVEVAHLEQHVRVVRVGLEEGAAGPERLVKGCALEWLLRGLQDLPLVDRQAPPPSQTSTEGAEGRAPSSPL